MAKRTTDAKKTTAPKADQAPAAPPAADPAAPAETRPYEGPVLVVTGPKAGFRRGGFKFDAEPLELTPADFGVEPGDDELSEPSIEAAKRFHAILFEPALKVVIRLPNGEEEPITPEALAAVRAHLETRLAEAGAGPIGELLEELLNA